MPALAETITDLSRELALEHARRGETILTEMLKRYFGSRVWRTPQEALDMLTEDGVTLFHMEHRDKDPEFILMRGPALEIGEKLDESCVIDRVPHHPLFQHKLIHPEIPDYAGAR